MTCKPNIIRKPYNVIVIDKSVTTIVFKSDVLSVKIKDEATKKVYWIQRAPVKKGLHMTGL